MIATKTRERENENIENAAAKQTAITDFTAVTRADGRGIHSSDVQQYQ
jgi:hypothetical protein